MPSIVGIDESLRTKIIKQLEYYFSDINLRNDHFIKKLAKKDSGWLSFETFLRFNRLKCMVNNDKNLLSQALKTLDSEVIECHPNGGKIRRRPDRPLPQMNDDGQQHIDELTVEVNGFPKNTTMDEILEWVQPFGPVLSIQMIRLKGSRLFDGCAVITFTDKGMANRLINQSPLKFKEVELTKASRLAQNECKRKQLASKIAALKSRVLVDKMKTVSMDTNVELSEASVGMEGTVLQLKGMPRRLVAKEKKKKTNRIKEFFSIYGKVIYVSSDSSGNCLIQFSDRSAAQKLLDSNKKLEDKEVVHKLVFNGKEVTARLLSATEELSFWLRAKRHKEKKRRINERKKLQRESTKSQVFRKRSNSSLKTGQEPKRLTPAIA